MWEITLTLALSHQGRGDSFHVLSAEAPAFAGVKLTFRADAEGLGDGFFAFVFHA